MTNQEAHPQELVCDHSGRHEVEVIGPREVPLGGIRAMRVRRTLPTRERSLIGAWCFLDHYGPQDVAASGGMDVPVHPHTGLQTVSWLFAGEIEHRDSAGNHAFVRPGELNLMTAGSGISHSERSMATEPVLHGVQLWVALPEQARHVERDFEHHVPPVVAGDGWSARVFLGSLLGDTSPVRTHTPLLGAQVDLEEGITFLADLDPSFEHGILVDAGTVAVAGRTVAPGELAHLPTGREVLEIRADAPARLVVLGGPPFPEPIVMWWNFVGRSHDEIAHYRAQWQDEVAGRRGVETPVFGMPRDDPAPPLPAPPLPHVRIRPRGGERR